MFKLPVLLASALLLSACVHHPGVQLRGADLDVEGVRVIIDADGHRHYDPYHYHYYDGGRHYHRHEFERPHHHDYRRHGEGHFCPPGQAKKGRC